MNGETFHRTLLPISSVSLLGSCETRFMEAVMGKTKVTTAMRAGTKGHERLTTGLPKVTKEEIMKKMEECRPIQVRELPVYDDTLKLAGRIDHLKMTGMIMDGRNTGIIIDDKYPSSPRSIHGLTLYYKLQLSAYAVAISNSRYYGNLCKIIGAQLVYRNKRNDSVIAQYEMDRQTLDICRSNVKAAVDTAWMLYHKKKEPVHRKFDVYNCEWTGCSCMPSNYHSGQMKMQFNKP